MPGYAKNEKIEVPPSPTSPLDPSLRQSLTDLLLTQTNVIPTLLSSLEASAKSAGLFDAVGQRATEVAQQDQDNKLSVVDVRNRIVREIMDSDSLKQESGDKEGRRVNGAGNGALELPKEMLDTAKKMVREGLEGKLVLASKEEREARENGWA